MANKIVLKKSSVAAKVPVAGDLDFGELAINYTDGKLYFKKADNTIDAFTTAAASAPVTSVGGNIGDITDAQLLASIKNVDGTGSGLDADTLDGNHASAFYLASNPNGYTSNTGTVTSVGATAPLVSSGGTDPSISIPAANSTTNGYMSSAYASKLDGIAAGATNVTNTNQLTNGAGFITSSASISGSAASAALLSAVGQYSFSSSTNGRDFNTGVQAGFVSDGQGYPSYGSVVRVKTYPNDGGTAELYFPYSSSYGGSAMRYRLGQYDNAGWTAWKTVLDSSNYTSYTMARDSWNGNLYFNNDGRIYSTIMYDSNDSGYYIDPNGTSNLSAVNIAGALVRLQKTHSEGGEIRLLNTASTAGGYIQGWDSGIRTVDHNWSTTTWSIDNAGNSIATASHRAPVFYDSNDTGYYIDPNSTSNSAQRMRGGTLYGPNPTWGAYLYVGTDGRVGTSATVAVTNGNLHLDAQDGYDIYLNNYNGRWVRTPGMYDNNDTGYYIDYNGTSRLNYVVPNRIKLVNNVNNEPRWDFSAYVVEAQHWYGNNSTQTMYLGESNVVYMPDIRPYIMYDRDNTGYYCDPNSTSRLATVNADGGNYYGITYFHANRNTTSDSPALQAYSSNGSGAIMSFHRGGYYAVNFGLDSDNVIRIGGWSASTNRLQMDMSGNLTMAGNVTAYSDERLKKDWLNLPSDYVENLAKITAGTYTRIDSEERQAGVSAQQFKLLLSEVVSSDNEGYLSLAYGNAALVSAVEIAKRVVDQEARIKRLESLIEKLI